MKILMCGDGNGAHVFCALAAQQEDIEINVLSLYKPVREKWLQSLEENATLSLNCINLDGTQSTFSGNPSLITDDPDLAMDGVSVIVLMNPAFTHFQYLKQLEPFVKPGLKVVALPGQTGFEYAVRKIWKEKRRHVNLIAFESLPWACKLSEIGRKATVFGYKQVLKGGPMQINVTKDDTEATVALIQRCIGPAPKLTLHYYVSGISLNTMNLILHPGLMYGQWGNWDGEPVAYHPKFYFSASEFGIEVVDGISSEVTAVSKAQATQCPKMNLVPIESLYDAQQRAYKEQIKDNTDLYTTIRSNKAYEEIMHPVKVTVDGLFVPDFSYRYITEDVPFGLVVVKGMAELAKVPTPTIDKVIQWGQTLMGKEYLVNGKLEGKDLHETTCPQACGVTAASELFESQ